MKIIPVLYNYNLQTFGKSRKKPAEEHQNKISAPSQSPNISYNDYTLQFIPKEKNINVVNEYFKLPQGCLPDEFQIESARAVNIGNDLIVNAPTGTGKTAIAQYAVSKNLKEGKKTFYTTPLKALSSQKYNEFKALWGEENVGILTGDRRENPNAPVLIMTTEVCRNMALSNIQGSGSELMNNLQTVIFDEFHYISDIERGSVWEETMIFMPPNVQVIALSATIGNSGELRDWFELRNGKKNKVSLVSIPPSRRHVPLKFDRMKTAAYKHARKNNNTNEETSDNSMPLLSDYNKSVQRLEKQNQLPAIFFVFSKKFSNNLADYFAQSGDDLTTKEEKKEIEAAVASRKDKTYTGSNLNTAALKKGYAVHNAGIMPEQKALIEELFQKKLVKVVIATETLAAGINMPAKTVVVSNIYKPAVDTDGSTYRRTLGVNEFNQMAGRAGRRGIDDIGYVYSMVPNKKTEDILNYLESAEPENLESRFAPDYPFLAGYYMYNKDDKKLNDIYRKSFFVFDKDKTIKKEKTAFLLNRSKAQKEVLLKRSFLSETEDGIICEPKGKMLSVIRGYDAAALALVESVHSGKFKNISPEALALIAASLANQSETDNDAITAGSFNEIFGKENDLINSLYFAEQNFIKQKLHQFGKTPDDFDSFESIKNFLDTVEIPDFEISMLRDKLNDLREKNAKLKIIQSNRSDYTVDELVNSFAKGSVIPSKTLEKYADITAEYKSKNNTDDITTVIEKIENKIAALDTSAKGSKTKSKTEQKIQVLRKQSDYAKKLKYLDARVFDEIGNNYEYLKKYSQENVEQEYKKYSALYKRVSCINALKRSVQSCIDIENYKKTHYIELESAYNKEKTNECINTIINQSEKIHLCETEVFHDNVQINKNILNPDMKAAQIVYKWALLNSVQSDGILSWKQLLKEHNFEMDEGSIYRIILQTNDLLCQFGDIAEKGYETAQNENEKEYYKNLSETAKKASKLLINNPVILN